MGDPTTPRVNTAPANTPGLPSTTPGASATELLRAFLALTPAERASVFSELATVAPVLAKTLAEGRAACASAPTRSYKDVDDALRATKASKRGGQ